MKLMLVTTLYPPRVVGGAERSVQVLAEALASRGHEVTVVCTTPEATPSRRTLNGVTVFELPLHDRYWPFEGQPGALDKAVWHLRDTHSGVMAEQLAGVLEQARPDLLHSNTLAGLSVSAWDVARRVGVPIVHTLRDYYLLCPRATMFRTGRNCERRCWDCRLYSEPRRRATRHVAAVVGNSRFILDKHLALGCFGAASQRTVIYNAYRADPSPPPAATSPITFGYLGRLGPTKGVDRILTAAAGLPRDGWRLLIAGRGDEAFASELLERASGLPIEYLGFVDPPTLFARLHALIVPSLWQEPLPRTIFEAYAHGVPVLASNRGGSPEIVDEGETGFIFDPDHAEQLADLMRGLLEQPERALSLRGACLRKALSFRPARTVDAYLDVYRTLLEQPAPPAMRS